MNAELVQRAIIENRPGEPFVLVERADGDEITDLSALDWQADTTPPAWAEVQTWAAAFDSSDQEKAWTQLRKIRDRWVNECQYVLDHAEGASTRTLSTAAVITENAQGWLDWRQAMLDLPETIGATSDPRPALAALAAAGIDSTADEFPAPWPQPPAAPVVFLT